MTGTVHGLVPHVLQDMQSADLPLQPELSLALMDGIAEPVMVIGLDYRILYANRAARDAAGKSIEGLSCHQVSHGRDVPCDGHAHPCPLARVAAGEARVRVMHRHLDARGGTILVELSATPVRDANGKVAGIIEIARDITAAEQSKAALERANRRLREAQRIAHIGSWEREFASDHIACSEEMRAIAGHGCSGRCGFATFLTAIHDEDRDTFLRSYERAIAEHRPFEMTHRLKQPDGMISYVHSHCETLYDTTGKPQITYGTVQDVTMSILAEMSLKESEERFRTIADYTYDWEYWEGPQGEILYCSPSCKDITGYSTSDFVANPALLYSIVHPDDVPLMAAHREGIHGKDADSLTFRIVRADGEIRWIAHGCRPVSGRHGQSMGRRASNRDITELKRVELEYQIILQTATDGFLLVDTQGRLLDCNAAYCVMSGHTREELLVMSVADIEANETPADIAQHIENIRALGHSRFEARHRRKDGSQFDVEISVSYLDVDGGKLVVFIRDVTERKQQEEQIRQLAYFDALTGLPNRRLLVDRLRLALTQAKRFCRSIAIMFLDLDRFKQINDTLGHNAGDELLKEVAQRLSACVRQGDTVARPGGDEFVIVLTEISQPGDATRIAEKILEAFRPPVLLMGQRLGITTSIGIAIYPINGDDDSEELMKKADMAMYEAKTAGRNTYRIFDPNVTVTP